MRVIWYPATTVDGFIADLDGDSSWVTEEDEHLFSSVVKKSGCVIVGRTTFDQYQDVIYPIEGTETFVCSSRPGSASNNVRYVGGSPHDVLEAVKEQGFSSVVLSGGRETNGRFAAAGLITEAMVSVYPKLLGDGVRLLGSHRQRVEMGSVTSTQLGAGVVQFRSEDVSFPCP